MRWIGRAGIWLATEYMRHYNESRSRAFDTIIKNNLHLNTIILTVSIASLTAIAALNKEVFMPHPILSFIVVALFVLVILFSTINFYLSGVVLRDIQRTLAKDILSPFRMSSGEYKQRFRGSQKVLNIVVFSGFCTGLITFLALLAFYILGDMS